jgi:hypothetical protein
MRHRAEMIHSEPLEYRSLPLALLLVCGAACSPSGPAVPANDRTEAPPAKTSQHAGQSFDHEVRLLFRVAACAGDEPVPAPIAATVDAHCQALRPYVANYRARYLARAQPFLTALQPKALPTTVVYPFGGGDLVTALTTYPALTEVTTLSLEHAGDPRRIVTADPQTLEESLQRLRKDMSGLLTQSDSTSENLMEMQRGQIPGQLAFFLVALAIHEQQPIGLRYFDIEADGQLHYLESAEIAKIEQDLAQRLHRSWESPDFSVAFSNMELSFRPGGGGAPRIHRHIAANLMDGPLKKDPRVLKYLERGGRVAAMTKAASYTLWSPNFSRIRNYLLANMEFMLSDSTGIPPQYAEKAGFLQNTYGDFDGPYLDANEKDAEDFRMLWESQPKRPLPFRYGYVDVKKRAHLLVTRRAEKP